jgi:hypothetical protein
MLAMKFCKDCRFAVREPEWTCHHPDAAHRELSVVTGEDRLDRNRCYYERQIGECGVGAKNWQPIETTGGGFV